MTFKFPYENIVRIKEKEKDTAYSEFGASLRKKQMVMEELEVLKRERDKQLREWEGATYSIAGIQQQNNYLNYVNDKILQMENFLSQLEAEVQHKQSEFLEKQKEERTWQYLFDKSFQEYLQKQKKLEQDMLDEMATIRYYQQRLSL